MSIATNIVVAQFNRTRDMILIGMVQYSTQRLGITCDGLTFDWSALTLITDEEIEFHATIFMIIIQFASHLSEDVSHKVFDNGPFVCEKVTIEDA